jgi:cell division protein FtsW (lipid II flippase)
MLLIAPTILVITGSVTLGIVRTGAVRWSATDLRAGVVLIGLAWTIHLALGLARVGGDQVLLPVVTMLAGLGLLEIERLQPALAALHAGPPQPVLRHLAYLVCGYLFFALTVVARRRLFLLQRYKYTALAASLGPLMALFAFGSTINGSRLWLRVGPIQAQPSEVVKVALVAFLAAYLSEKRDVLDASWKLGVLRLPPIPTLLPMGLMWAAAVLILLGLNDLGIAFLFFCVFLAMLYAATGRALFVLGGLLAFAAAAWVSNQHVGRVGIRVQNWLDPWQAPLTTGYQQVQADYALASGGVLGAGLGQGQPWRIPEVQTDYIFAAIGEEWGLAGTVALIALFAVLTLRGLAIALRAPAGLLRLLATGCAVTLGTQALIILAGVARVIPLTGITLPFIAYGGSSLLANFVLVGLLVGISALPPARLPGGV